MDVRPRQRYLDGIQPPQPPAKAKNRRSLIYMYMAAPLLLLLISAGAYLYLKPQPQPFNSASRLGQISFPVYYPVSDTNSFTLLKDSLRSEQGIVFFEALTKRGHKVVFSQQAKPGGADYSFLKGDQTIATDLGLVQIKHNAKGLTGSIETEDSLIIANSVGEIDQASFVQLLREFKRLN